MSSDGMAMGPVVRRTKPTRIRSLSPDANGYYRPYVGWKMPDWPQGHRRVQNRFNLGKDLTEAQRRYTRIQELYADSCRATEEDVWSPFALGAANLLAQGVYRIPYFCPYKPEEMDDPVAEYAQLLEIERQRYPSLDIVPGNAELFVASRKANREIERHAMSEVESILKRQGVIASDRELPEEIIPGSLHEALDDFVTSDIHGQNVVAGTNELTQHGTRRKQRINRQKEHSEDIPLSSLGLDELKELVNHWRSRPPHKRSGNPVSKAHAGNQLRELKRFFLWLDCSEKFRWQKPRGYDSIRWTVADDAKAKVPVHKQTYSPLELARIAEHLDDMGKFALVVGLNCAMGAAELGRLTVKDFLLDHQHEFSKTLKFTSTKEDSFCRYFRPKSKVFGEWALWPETIKWVRWSIARANRIGSEVLLVDEDGRGWYRENAPNPQYVFANMWTSVTEKLNDLPKYPFGSIRDTLPDELRQTVGDELASLCLSHGNRTGSDKLIDCYSNRPFGRLHRAIRNARKHYAPVLAVLAK